jgi:sodium/hydrogen antiporter
VLAPTDAALGQAVVTSRAVPARIRQALNVESGLNDGGSVPFRMLFIALAAAEEGLGGGWLAFTVEQIGLGALVGVAVGVAGGRALATAVEREWALPLFAQLALAALAIIALIAADAIGGNGFIAAFVGGLAFGAATRYRLGEATEFTEEVGTVLSTFVWIIFGTTLVVPLLRAFDARAFVFAILALTVARMVPVAISMIGSGLRPDTVLLMGWLGPRGLASVVFTLIAVEALHESAQEVGTLAAMAGWTIALSVLLHALTAAPLARWYARRLQTAVPDAPELLPSPELAPHRTPGKHRSFGIHQADVT